MLTVQSAWPYTEKEMNRLCQRLSEVLRPWPFPTYTIDSHWINPTYFLAQASVIRHVHQFYEGFVILDGEIELVTPWQTQRVEPGSLLVLSPGTIHQWQTQEQDCLSLVFSFDLDRQLITPTNRRWPVCPEVLWDVRVLLANVAAAESGWQMRAHCHVGVIYSRLLEVLERSSTQELDLSGTSQLTTRIDELLLAYLADPLTLDEIGEHVSMSARHLSRVFYAMTGSTVHERLDALRMERAAKLLRTTNLSVEDVAHAVGITNAAYFARRFRRRFYVTPRKYRQHLNR